MIRSVTSDIRRARPVADEYTTVAVLGAGRNTRSWIYLGMVRNELDRESL